METNQTTNQPAAIVTSSGRIALRARFLGPTNNRGARIKVSRGDHQPGDTTTTIGWDHALNLEENYAAAIRAHIERMGWDGTWVIGSTTDGYVAVQTVVNAR